jgi:hypothetical protein
MSREERSGHPLGMIHVPRPASEEEEQDLADYLAGLLRRQDHREIGASTGRDGDPGSALISFTTTQPRQ